MDAEANPPPCSETVDMVRAAFGAEDFSIPPIYDAFSSVQHVSGTPICFDEVLVPQMTHAYARDAIEMDTLRSSTWRMCGLHTARVEPPRRQANRVTFYERYVNRQLVNAEEICVALNALGLEASLLVETFELCSELAALSLADVIVVVQGTHVTKLGLLRSGVVVVNIYPYGVLRGRERLFLSRSNIHMLDLVMLFPSTVVAPRCVGHFDPTELGKRFPQLWARQGPDLRWQLSLKVNSRQLPDGRWKHGLADAFVLSLKHCASNTPCTLYFLDHSVRAPLRTLLPHIGLGLSRSGDAALHPCQQTRTHPNANESSGSKWNVDDPTLGWEMAVDFCTPDIEQDGARLRWRIHSSIR